MGTKERQDRERLSVRTAILTAARELFVAEGYRNVSMRKIADRIEYSPAAIYSYFPSKDDIFFALAEEGFRLMGDAAAGVITADGDPIDTLRDCFWAYYRFSREQPQYFDLVFVDRSVPQISEEWARFSSLHTLLDEVTAVILRGIEKGVIPSATDPGTACHLLWAAMHGPAVIALCNRLSPTEDPDALARDTLEAALTALQQGFPTTFLPERCPLTAAVPAGESTDALS